MTDREDALRPLWEVVLTGLILLFFVPLGGFMTVASPWLGTGVVLVGSVLLFLTKWPHSADSRRVGVIGVLLSVGIFLLLTQVWAFDHGKQCSGDGNMVSARLGAPVVWMIPFLLSVGFGATAVPYPSRSTLSISRGMLSRMFLLVGLTYLGSGLPFFGC